MLYWPDTTLTYEITPGDLLLYIGYLPGSVGVKEIYQDKKQFQLFQNFPNPVKDQSLISNGKAFKHIYWFFFFVGIYRAITSGFFQIFNTESFDKKVEISEDFFKGPNRLNKKQIDILIKKTKVLELDLKITNNKLDSITKILESKK